MVGSVIILLPYHGAEFLDVVMEDVLLIRCYVYDL